MKKQLSIVKTEKMLKVKKIKRAVPKDTEICYCQTSGLSAPHYGHK